MLSIVMNYLNGFINQEEGQGMVEYALIIALVAIIAIAGLVLLGPVVRDLFTDIAGEL